MKNKKVLFGICLIVIVSVIAAVVLSNRTSSLFAVDNKDNSISVTAQRAGDGVSGIGYVTIEEGQELHVRSNLTDSSSITIEVFPSDSDATGKALMEETFTAVDSQRFELQPGNYMIRISAKQGATGSMDITSE